MSQCVSIFDCRFLFALNLLPGLLLLAGMAPGTWGAQDEAGVSKQQNFIQTDNVTVQPDGVAPFSFVGSLKKAGTALTQTGTVALPAGSSYTPNPFTVISPAQLAGTHYYYSVPYSSLSSLEAMFPAGTYQFDTTRNYFSGATTNTSQGVTFTGSHGMPSQVPKLNGTWMNGKLVVPAGTVDLSWDLWEGPKSPQSRIEFRITGTNVSGWAIQRSDENSVKLAFLKPNTVYQASLRFLNVEDQQTVVDTNTIDKDLGFCASYSTVTQFAVEVLPDPTWPLLGTLTPTPSSKGIAGTASNSVVVGSSGRMAVLDHATGTWQVRDSVTSKTWNAVIHANGQFLAVGSGGSVRTSPDGNTWTDRATGRTEALQSVIWTGSQYVAVGDGGLILVSADGVTWTVRTSGILTPLLTVAYSGGVYVAAGDAGIRISNDSISWRAPSNSGSLGGGSTLCWARNKFLLGTTAGVNKLWQSTDGETWSSVQGYSDGVSRLISVSGVAYASGIGGQGAYLKRSLDGVGWSDISPLGRIQIYRMAWNGEALILLDADGHVVKGLGLPYEFFSFEQATSNHKENVGPAAVKVLRHGPATTARSVDYETEAGSATDGQDYAGSSGTINFLAGETMKTLTFDLTNDTQIEEFESFAVLLKSPPEGTELGGPSATWIGIVDDEPRPVFQFQLASQTVSEEAGFVDLQVVRSWDVAIPAAVSYATQADSATAGLDYEAASGVVSFAAGETLKTLRIHLISNQTFEWAHRFSVTLSASSPDSSLGAVAVTVVNLVNDDAAPAGLTILDAMYGGNGIRNDVKSQINASISSNTVNMTVNSTTMGGDPVWWSAKNLLLRYQNADGHFSQTVSDGGNLRIPSPQAQRLPMAYAQWLSTKFNSTEQGEPQISGDMADPNRNGIPNLMEYALDLDPKSTVPPWDKGVLPQGNVAEVGGVNRLTLSYRPNAFASNLTYVVEVSDDLNEWHSGTDHVEQISAPGAVPVVMADKTPVNGEGVSKRFIRLRVVRE